MTSDTFWPSDGRPFSGQTKEPGGVMKPAQVDSDSIRSNLGIRGEQLVRIDPFTVWFSVRDSKSGRGNLIGNGR